MEIRSPSTPKGKECLPTSHFQNQAVRFREDNYPCATIVVPCFSCKHFLFLTHWWPPYQPLGYPMGFLLTPPWKKASGRSWSLWTNYHDDPPASKNDKNHPRIQRLLLTASLTLKVGHYCPKKKVFIFQTKQFSGTNSSFQGGVVDVHLLVIPT